MYILSVKVDNITMSQALDRVEGWLKDEGGKKHYITTPNLEFIKDAQKDPEFKKILNQSDLAVPDSSHLDWLKKISDGELTPIKSGLIHFEVVPGIDLMESLCKMASEKGFTVGLLGAGPGVAERAAECLLKKYPKLIVSYAVTGTVIPAPAKGWSASGGKAGTHTNKTWIPEQVRDDNVDLLFVAFGHVKQEKWIAENLSKIPVKVAMGVGGAFDYISGNIPRASKWIRNLGMEWLFRLIVQPWRIKRQASLIWFLINQLKPARHG